jgi:hypothetical protein
MAENRDFAHTRLPRQYCALDGAFYVEIKELFRAYDPRVLERIVIDGQC